MRNLTVSLIVAIGVMGGFYVGFRYEKSKVPDTTNTSSANIAALQGAARQAVAGATPVATGGGTGSGGGGFAGRGTIGTVESIAGNVLTIKDAQGNEVKVQLQSSTTITKTVSGSTSDLTQGVNVAVAGQRGSDGSVTANSITIVPAR